MVPTLLLDTCSVVDLAPFPHPMRSRASQYAEAVKVVVAAEAGACAIVQASVVPTEIDAHLDDTFTELYRASRDAQTLVGELNVTAQALGLPLVNLPPIVGGPHLPAIGSLIARLRSSSQVLPESGTAARAGLQRANLRRAPAAAKRGEIKDCIIVEEYAALGRERFVSGQTPPIVFLTSNTDDFSDPKNKGYLHPQIAVDFDPLGIVYANSWGHARHLLCV